MERKRKLYIAKSALALGVVPVLIWAHNYGPDPGKNGVPGESNCTESQCHVGTALNGGPGSVAVAFPNGQTYAPGVKQHLVVTISDPSERVAGFQLTARASGNTKSQAGSFASTDQNTLVLCSDTNLRTALELDAPNSQVCPAAQPLSYMEHNLTGASRIIGNGTETFEFDWTPPATDIGNVTIYVEGNGANGDGSPNGDHIYKQMYTLTPSASSGTPPSISANGVVNGASFQPGIVPNSWITIQGSDLSLVTDTWANAIVNGQLPTTLDNVSVSVGGKPAYVYFVSPQQINAVAPDAGTGTMSVTVTTPGGTSAAVSTNAQTVSPAFFLWANQYAVATRQDFSWAVKNGTFSGTTTVPAKPGDVIILWGTGFGPTAPATPAGVQVPSDQIYATANPVTVTVGTQPAQVIYAVLAPGFAGLYQVAIQVPDGAPNGDLPVVATVNGVSSPSGVTLTVQK